MTKDKNLDFVTQSAFVSGVNLSVAPDLGLAGQDITLRLVLFRQGILDGHAHVARYESNAARSACSRAVGVVDEDASLVGRIEDGRVDKTRS